MSAYEPILYMTFPQITKLESEAAMAEKERIIKLLEDIVSNWRKCDLHNQADTFDYAIALIKGEK